MKKLLLFLLLVSPLWAENGKPEQTPPPPAALESVVMAAEVWDTPAPQFVEANEPLGFKWLSDAHEAAQSVRKNVQFLGMPVLQTVARFQGGENHAD